MYCLNELIDDFGIQKTKIKTINFKGGDYIIMREKKSRFLCEMKFYEWNLHELQLILMKAERNEVSYSVIIYLFYFTCRCYKLIQV